MAKKNIFKFKNSVQFTDDELFYLERELFFEQEACEFFKKKNIWFKIN